MRLSLLLLHWVFVKGQSLPALAFDPLLGNGRRVGPCVSGLVLQGDLAQAGGVLAAGRRVGEEGASVLVVGA